MPMPPVPKVAVIRNRSLISDPAFKDVGVLVEPDGEAPEFVVAPSVLG